MKKINSVIFGNNYEIRFQNSNTTIYEAIEEQLSYYQKFSDRVESDVVVTIRNDMSNHLVLKKNPSTHWEIENGFIVFFPTYSVAFYLANKKLNIDLVIKPSGNFLFSFLRKIQNMEFATREERIAQTLFEGALIPSIFFDKNKILVHSSGFINDESTIIIGGTGGSGKTSLEIELCLNNDFKFVNDDIAVINTESLLFPNLAHPKIYGYNLKGNKILKTRLFKKLSILNKIHWWITFYVFGPARVRRRLFINKNLTYSNKPSQLKKYFILSKENVDKITCEKVSSDMASELHHKVILAEYNLFLNHFYWHEFNSLIDKKDPIIRSSEVNNNLLNNAKLIFNNADNYVIRIPFNIKHSEFLKTAIKKIKDSD